MRFLHGWHWHCGWLLAEELGWEGPLNCPHHRLAAPLSSSPARVGPHEHVNRQAILSQRGAPQPRRHPHIHSTMQSLQASSCGQLRCCSQPSCSPVLQRGRGIRPNVMAFYIPEVQSGPSHPSPSSSLACSTPIPQLHNSSRPEQSCPPLPLPATSPRHVPATLLSCGLLVAGAMLLMPGMLILQQPDNQPAFSLPERAFFSCVQRQHQLQVASSSQGKQLSFLLPSL